MALQSSGAISLSDIQTEFGGANPISLSEYYKGGAYVPDTAANINVPTSGLISLSNFYGAEATPPASPLNPGTVNLYSFNADYSAGTPNAFLTIATKTFVYGATSTLTYRVRGEGFSYACGRETCTATRTVRWLKNGGSIVSVTSPAGVGNNSSIVSANVSTATNDVLKLQVKGNDTTIGGNANVLGQIRADSNPGGTLA